MKIEDFPNMMHNCAMNEIRIGWFLRENNCTYDDVIITSNPDTLEIIEIKLKPKPKLNIWQKIKRFVK